MMKGAVVALLLAVGGASGVTVIDFDSYAPGDPIPIGSFDALGVRFNENLAAGDDNFGLLPSSPPVAAFNNDLFYDDITGFFLGSVTSVTSISVYAGDEGGDQDDVELRGYNAANALVDSDFISATSAQWLSISGPGIVRFEIDQTGFIGIDDFTFNPIPEASTYALFGLGALGLAVWRRRKR